VPDAEVVMNPDWTEGMGSSLRAGLTALTGRSEVESVVVTLVDLPGLTSLAVQRILEADADIVVATYQGERGHPVRFARSHWPDVMAVARGDQGARRFLGGRDDIAFVEVGDLAQGDDMDVPAES
jgi:nicotine blue oxidoreductase